MRYSVVWNPFAHYRLGEIWLQAENRQAVADACDRIDAALRQNPEQFEIEGSNEWRIIAVSPLVATFELSADDRKVTVLSVRLKP